jgi:hypothetical protein
MIKPRKLFGSSDMSPPKNINNVLKEGRKGQTTFIGNFHQYW